MPPRRKSHRLPREAYQGQICIGFTACELRRQPVLATEEFQSAFRKHLSLAAANHLCNVPIYTLMPDHLHVLMRGSCAEANGYDAMIDFKTRSGKWLFASHPHLHWQHDFYDRIVRWSVGWRSQARYIACNPIRKGLVEHPEEWPYTGSIGYNLNEILGDAF